MTISVESGSELARAIQAAVQPKLTEAGWVADESDTTLADYVVLMVVNGKTQEQVISELGTDLLGVGEDDPAVAELAQWLFQLVPTLHAQMTGQPIVDSGAQDTGSQQGPDDSGYQEQEQDNGFQQVDEDGNGADTQMNDAVIAGNIPSGPKAMRNGTASASGRGRDKRILGHLNRQMDRTQDGGIRKNRGAGGVQVGRGHPHAGHGVPRGPRANNYAAGMQRMMNGRSGQQFNQMMPGQQPGDEQQQQQQLQFMQMMEMGSQMMAQMFNGQVPDVGASGPNFQNQPSGKSLFERVEKRSNGGFQKGGQRGQHIHNAFGNDGNGMGMDVDRAGTEDGQGKSTDPFDTMCHFNTNCTVPTCPYAHQSPAAPPGTAVDLTDRCSFGGACENRKCSAKHPSPAQRRQHEKEGVDCKFFPNCHNPTCPFRHPEMPPCRNGADCTQPGCKFSHSKISCRYDPCLNPACMYKHTEAQKRGNFEDKVWTADKAKGDKADKADRFKELSEHTEQEEELILPEQNSAET